MIVNVIRYKFKEVKIFVVSVCKFRRRKINNISLVEFYSKFYLL